MTIKRHSALIFALAVSVTGCDRSHEDEHDGHHDHHAESEGGHDPHADAGNDHSTVHRHDGSNAHEHHLEAIAVTHFTDRSELFVEYPALVVGEESAFAAHLTRLDDFLPVAEGRLTVRLAGGGLPEETFSVDAPSTPGIFRPVARPANAGQRTLELILESPALAVKHDLGPVRVYADKHSATAAQLPEEEAGDAISFLKEQQWKVDFATAEVTQRRLRVSVPATGTIKARSDGEAMVSAPSAGHLIAGEVFPRIGARVSRGEPLAEITPRVAGEVDATSLQLAVQRTRSQLQLAVRERERLADLVSQQAVPEKRLTEAETAERVARAELTAATERLAQYQRTLGSGEPRSTSLTVRAPIDGRVAEIRVTAGSFVDEGQAMFHIVDTGRLWLEVNVAEADIGRLQHPEGAWFEVEGFDQVFQVDTATGGQLIAFGNVVDPISRTVPLVFEFPNPESRLRVGMFAQVHIWTGERADDCAVPAEALVDEAGQDVAYVMLGGESFERRVVRTGIRDGDYVQIRSGLEAGERIVTRGAYLVRLAAAAPAEAGHGHAH